MRSITNRRRVFFRRAAIILLISAVAGGYVAVQWTELNVKWTARRLRNATNEQERLRYSSRLLALGDAGITSLLEEWKSDDAARCQTATQAVEEYLGKSDEPRRIVICRTILTNAATFSSAGQEATLDFITRLLTTADADDTALCHDRVQAGLVLPATEARVRAVRLAMRPVFNLRPEVVRLLNDPEAEVRRAAMLAVGPHDGQSVPAIADDDLFRWLHDPDWDVRQMCESALASRGFEPDQIAWARMLSHEDPAERLRLVDSLSKSRRSVRDPGPWLERLCRDPEPAVRVGAARVACECQLAFTGWLDRLSKQDPDPTVRQIIRFHRARAADVRPVRFDDR